MALHGSATIELTNADGSKQIVKHDNMITNAVNDMLTSFRGEMPLVMRMASTGDSFVKHLFGGIMLFNERLTDDPADYAINTTKITGYASQDAYNGTDLARGSANLAESGLQEDGSYKLVFDFSTSQGNGTIQSLGLCPNVMGQIGATDAKDTSSGVAFSLVTGTIAPFNSSGKLLSDRGSTADISNTFFRIVAIMGDVAYAVNYYNLYKANDSDEQTLINNGGVLKLYKFKLGAFSVGLNNNVGMATYLDCIDVQLPEDFINTLNNSSVIYTVSYYFDVDNKKLIVFPCAIKTDVAVNGTVMYVEIDLANDMAITKHTFTNTTAGVLKAGAYAGFNENSHSNHFLYILKEYIVLIAYVSNKYRMYVINRADNAKVVEAKLAGESFEPSYSSDWVSGFSPVYVNDNVFVFSKRTSKSYTYDYYMIDLKTGEVKVTNSTRFYPGYTVSFGNKASIVYCNNCLTYHSYLNPFILTTKNNLDTPVQKTASQTMKITYTLTESEGV